MSVNKESIYRRIKECRDAIEQYSKDKYELRQAVEYCKQAGNGIELLMNGQYEKVKTECTKAIGEEDDLLAALNVKHTNLPQACSSIEDSLNNGISGIEKKIEELQEEIKQLLSEL